MCYKKKQKQKQKKQQQKKKETEKKRNHDASKFPGPEKIDSGSGIKGSCHTSFWLEYNFKFKFLTNFDSRHMKFLLIPYSSEILFECFTLLQIHQYVVLCFLGEFVAKFCICHALLSNFLRAICLLASTAWCHAPHSVHFQVSR